MIQKSKIEWRALLKKRRSEIPRQRREEASHLILQKLKSKGRILSFSPIGSEINITALNEYLQRENRLFLVPYRVESIFEVPFAQIDCILVPGLGFDRERYRIGYGQGYYDRLLSQAGAIPTIGVGFKEQFCSELLPRDPWDLPVQELILV